MYFMFLTDVCHLLHFILIDIYFIGHLKDFTFQYRQFEIIRLVVSNWNTVTCILKNAGLSEHIRIVGICILLPLTPSACPHLIQHGMHQEFGSVGAVCSIEDSSGHQNHREYIVLELSKSGDAKGDAPKICCAPAAPVPTHSL